MIKKLFFTIFILLLISFTSFILYKDTKVASELLPDNNEIIDTTEDANSEPVSIDNLETGDTIEIAPGVFAELVETQSSTSTLPIPPSLERKIVFPEETLDVVREKTTTEINKFVGILKKDPTNFESWIDLGIYRKLIEDYEGAKEAWQFASILRPNSALPVSNLGNLYGYYLKDKTKAEEYYLNSLTIEPNVGFWYYQAYVFYREVMQDESKAREIIERGVKNNPGDEDLKNILNSF